MQMALVLLSWNVLDLNLNKTIDLITIYGEPQKLYELSYKFNILADEIGETIYC